MIHKYKIFIKFRNSDLNMMVDRDQINNIKSLFKSNSLDGSCLHNVHYGWVTRRDNKLLPTKEPSYSKIFLIDLSCRTHCFKLSQASAAGFDSENFCIHKKLCTNECQDLFMGNLAKILWPQKNTAHGQR